MEVATVRERTEDDIEAEAEEEEGALRGRLPRHPTTNDNNTAIITSSTVISTASKDVDDDEEKSSSDVAPRNGALLGENGNGNGDAKSTIGHSRLDDRNVDFLVSEENPIEQVVKFGANDFIFQKSDVVVVNSECVIEIEKDNKNFPGFGASTSMEENGVPNSSVNNESVRDAQLRKKINEESRELCLENLSYIQGQHEFYCPNCKTCITKVLVLVTKVEDRRFRCTSCFSFLLPISDREQDSPKSWEIAKSIIYGGLAESITSLGVVTSAASGDATTLNIVALALANLIGGLFVIAHNIWKLRDDKPTVDSSRTNQPVDNYYELLGSRQNFFLHATFAILSFLAFGLNPPIVYGFTFRESDDKDLKLVAVGVASLICIVGLAVGKAYIQRPHEYIKTITSYFVMGFGVSAASYLAGQLISRLLEKIDSSESTSALAMPLPGMGPSRGAWGSY